MSADDGWRYHDYLEVVQQVTYVLVLVLAAYFFSRLVKVKRVHANFRLVLACVVISFLGFNGTRIPIQYLMKYVVTSVDDPSYRLCRWLVKLNMIISGSGMNCMNMLAVEQTIATVWVESYEGRSIRLGVVLVAIAVLPSIPNGLFLFHQFASESAADLRNMRLLNSCTPSDYRAEMLWLIFPIAFAVSGLCLLYLHFLRRHNNKKSANRLRLSSLSARFQQTENTNSTASIQPALTVYMTLSLVGIALTGLRQHYVNRFGQACWQNLVISDVCFFLTNVYAANEMLCFMYFNNAMRQLVVRDLERLFANSVEDSKMCRSRHRPVQINPKDEVDIYFKNYAWS